MPSAPASTLDEDATLALPDERYQGPPVPSPDERPLAFPRLFANGRWAVQSPPELIAALVSQRPETFCIQYLPV